MVRQRLIFGAGAHGEGRRRWQLEAGQARSGRATGIQRLGSQSIQRRAHARGGNREGSQVGGWIASLEQIGIRERGLEVRRDGPSERVIRMQRPVSTTR